MSKKEKIPEKIRPITGYQMDWGMVGPRFWVKPYTLTDGATDVLKIRVREKIDIHGVGTDVVQMTGTFVVRRGHPTLKGKSERPKKWGEGYIDVEFRNLELYGESPLFGTVRVSLNTEFPSIGRVGAPNLGSVAVMCRVFVHPRVELPNLNLTLTTGDEAIVLSSKVVQIPPIGDVARSETGKPLIDEHGQVVGELISADIEVGELIHTHRLGATMHDPRFDRDFGTGM